MQCQQCSAAIGDGALVCAQCGASVPSPTTVRLEGNEDAETPLPGARQRFPAGTIVAERFRIISLLGRGGMGEVYRADDLKLGQQVALKFLPSHVASDPARIERLYAEVRLARQVTHPNVCRVYDIASTADQQFISMELVEGEDLAHLMRRIGRLPKAKSMQIARQVALGLAAAHASGVVHRDLKPANILIDDRGNARITDFGLAVSASDAARIRSAGTPAYMAPEQLDGRTVTNRSDLYSLGLVLYELFTGTAAYRAANSADLLRLRAMPLARPSTIAPDVDRAIETIILSCLAEEPDKRPASADIIATAFAADDPLAAAIAAGMTPSPEDVANAPSAARLPAVAAVACLAAIIASLVAVAVAAPKLRLSTIASFESASVLDAKARDIVTKLGSSPGRHTAVVGWVRDKEFISSSGMMDRDRDWTKFRDAQFVPAQFVWRSSPQALVPTSEMNVEFEDPPAEVAHMQTVRLDPHGRLRYFREVTQQNNTTGPPVATNWAVLPELAGFPFTTLTEAKSQWTPPDFADERRAWQGRVDGIAIRVEAAAYHGHINYFEIVFPWSQATRDRPPDAASSAYEFGKTVGMAAGVLILGIVALLAWRNAHLRRGDRDGAWRLASVAFVLTSVSWLCHGTHVLDFDEMNLLEHFLGEAFVVSLLAWSTYMALEPHLRRRWPHSLISWTRLLRGEIRDVVVARDVLIGCAAAAIIVVLEISSTVYFRIWAEDFQISDFQALLGAAHLAGILASMTGAAIFFSFLFYVVLYVLLLIGRKPFIATALFVAPWLILSIAMIVTSWRNLPFLVAGLNFTLLLLLAEKFGVLAVVSAFTFRALIKVIPATNDLTAWYTPLTAFGWAVLLLVCGYYFWIAIDGRQFVRRALMEGSDL